MRTKRLLSAASGLALALVCGAALAQDAQRQYSPVTNDMILNPAPGDWLQARGTVDNHGYSPLDHVNRDTVGDLELAWSWALPELGRQESAPLYHDGILFVATNNNHVEALDAVTGDLIWRYMHERPEFSGGYHNNQAMRQKNSIALWGDKVIMTTVDAKLMALDAMTGQVAWEVQVNDWEKGYSYTAGPLIADGKIFTGTSGCSMVGTVGACWITAHDADTGEELWRFNTLDQQGDPLFEASWGGIPVKNRWGATPWATGAYDPDLDMVFYGTGMPIPYAHISRGMSAEDDARGTNTTVALNADTGELVWNYQHLPNDNWDLDSPFERLVVEATVDGQPRKMIVTMAGKNGVVFGLDAATGQFIWGETTFYTNSITGIDKETGRVQTNKDLYFTEFGQKQTFCPAINGGRLWMASAYSPRSGVFYAHGANTCQTSAPREMNIGAMPAAGNAMGMLQSFGTSLAPGAEKIGAFHALNAGDGSKAFEIQHDRRYNSSVLATGGGLIFVGDVDRRYYAMNDETGEVLWTSPRLHAPAGGWPMTYEAGGEQYVVLPVGLTTNAQAALTPGLQMPALGANAIYVYKLPKG
ncbi:PQQ-binding-like beta-propeller repeat protein [Halovulum dunhuangense]|uniref:PQQ-binding-like beta-propeller repeat protein n=1 Tax=Halovulum dunhuangense TaxID=1505036 RepID=A0A849L0W8_9RHOB|nr:PQQ-binding-like beta-propeller repeat protein [Halovulum dunhuangense]NNU79928.1 PQQ-binding-like beta-propeller repeat protein [Halovulum dunhuangense]